MEKVYNVHLKLSNCIFFIEKYLLLIAVTVVIAVNFINVCLRYLANNGLSYCETLSVCLFMFVVIFGANISVKTDNEIKIEIFRFKSPRRDAAFRLFADMIAIAAIIFCLAGLFATIESVMRNLQRVTPLPIYTYHIYIAMAIGFFMILLDHIIVFIRHLIIMLGGQVEREAKTI